MSRRSPELPVGLELGGAPAARSRFDGAVSVEGAFVDRLRSCCAGVDVSDPARNAAGRDWWPLSMHWALDGTVAARPAVVARPGSAREVADVVALCHEAHVPVTAAAGRSGVMGGSVPAFGGVALDLTALAGIAAVDDASLLVDVRAGTFGDDFETDLQSQYGLTLGHWPQSIALSSVGGWVACRSAGQYSTRYGKIEDMVAGLEVALADGRLIRTGYGAPRAATGPDLSQLFVGSEGTLGVITEVRLRVHPRPPAERRGAWGFAGFAEGLDCCRRILRRGATPAVLRLYDPAESARHFDLGDQAVLIVLDEGDPALVDATIAVVDEECRRASATSGAASGSAGAESLPASLVGRWLEGRNAVPSLDSLTRAGIVADTIEVAAAWSALPTLYQTALAALSAIEGTIVASAHQSHAYTDGACLYFSFAGRPPEAISADAYYRRAWDDVMAATLAQGGAISHHHGIGLNRGHHLSHALGPAFDVLVALKAALDPHGVLNPGKLGLPTPFGSSPWP
ncbi:MAG: FAD-binding oxidoreductase [Acidimicrobiales bacterium]